MKYEEAVELLEKKLGSECVSVLFTNRVIPVHECVAKLLVDAGIIEKPEEKLYYIKVTEEPDGYLNLNVEQKRISLKNKWQMGGLKTKFMLEEIKENPLLAPFIDKIVPVEDGE